ncbi:hypothetical protein AB1Y20_016152 [Prymnesium parvum]|uniref:Glycosyltransferase 61 catalytic domain-containing protein n=1 Tax=Prymnesium parvum TaxID=97485 RepID=A0AB34K2M0_PRYPA
MASGGAASASLCSSTPARVPTLLARTSARQGGRAFVASEALAVPTVWNVCNASSVRCVRTVALTSPFSAANPAPRAAGLTPADDPHVRRQFWWQRHPYAAPRPFGWLWPSGGGGAAIQNESRATPRERRERARAITRLEHSYSVAVGRVLSPRGGFVEGCARCAHEAAIYAPPTPHHSTPGTPLHLTHLTTPLQSRRCTSHTSPLHSSHAAAPHTPHHSTPVTPLHLTHLTTPPQARRCTSHTSPLHSRHAAAPHTPHHSTPGTPLHLTHLTTPLQARRCTSHTSPLHSSHAAAPHTPHHSTPGTPLHLTHLTTPPQARRCTSHTSPLHSRHAAAPHTPHHSTPGTPLHLTHLTTPLQARRCTSHTSPLHSSHAAAPHTPHHSTPGTPLHLTHLTTPLQSRRCTSHTSPLHSSHAAAPLTTPPAPRPSAGAALLVDWRAGVVADPPARAPRRARAAYYALATRAPLLSFARLLVLAQRFSSDYGHFLTELLPRLVVARAEILADPQMHLFVDCSARFVRPWLRFFLGDVSARLVCSEARRLVHADCLAFARFATPFTSGWRLGLERVRAAAHRQAGVAEARASRLAVWADRDLSARGGGTVNRVRHVPRAQQILAALRARLPDYRLVDFRGSKFSPAQTVQLFSAASLVLGPSGSAMHNVLFCRPGALVVEILPADLSYAAIWQDAVLLRLHYRAFHLPGFTCATNATFSDAEIERLASGISACLAGIEGATPSIEAAKVDGQKHHRLQGTTPHLKKRALRRRRFDGNPVVV